MGFKVLTPLFVHLVRHNTKHIVRSLTPGHLLDFSTPILFHSCNICMDQPRSVIRQNIHVHILVLVLQFFSKSQVILPYVIHGHKSMLSTNDKQATVYTTNAQNWVVVVVVVDIEKYLRKDRKQAQVRIEDLNTDMNKSRGLIQLPRTYWTCEFQRGCEKASGLPINTTVWDGSSDSLGGYWYVFCHRVYCTMRVISDIAFRSIFLLHPFFASISP